MTNTPEVPQAISQDMVTVLRAIATDIENGLHPKTSSLVVVMENRDHSVQIFGAGGSNYYRMMTLLTRGQHKLISLHTLGGGL